MGATKRFAIGLGLAGGAALFAAWLLSGPRGQKAKGYLAKKAQGLKQALKKEMGSNDENEAHYI
ncbi:MAG: hypothetical protein M9954_04520 [Cyclobacteriaceae bacterium]|nr:hypothetical protein [Cyclobacteriaceae bacterium]MCB9237194.1 hypothetical protein [Flammeovirgaceae bacterium]MCB0499988.1 hypothetical protein [Cyclobacteriaceae bacterium]MCO5270903.1 hypothetical protein [Cyclobacteriaceae bacterium]MCW5901811.1 hypothetical protein [Cyclobacteriaceae bacterium]